MNVQRVRFFLLMVLAALTGAAIPAFGETASMEDAVFFVETDNGKGAAFLVEGPTGDVWMVSSSSVFEGAKKCTIANAAGVEVPFPDQVLVAKDRDLILFRTDRTEGLRRAGSGGLEEELLAFSQCKDHGEKEAIERLETEKRTLEEKKKKGENIIILGSGGFDEGVLKDAVKQSLERTEKTDKRLAEIDKEIAGCRESIQKRQERKNNAVKMKNGFLLAGRSVTTGPDRIEISAQVDHHDNGGPVVNKNREVIGISSCLIERSGLPEWMIEGTRWADPGRFALKLDGAEWMPMTQREYRRETGFIRENVQSLMVLVQMEEALNDNYYQKISLSAEDKDIQEWIESHNRLITDGRPSSEEVGGDFAALIKMVKGLENAAGRARRVTIPYCQAQAIELEKMYRAIRERIEQVRENR
jgi:hypothetical protein